MEIFERVNELLGTKYKSNEDINWDYISDSQKLSESFIREFQDEVDWYGISARQKLSECFIREFQDKVEWHCISAYQKLSECFIREFQNKVNWHDISVYQKLSEDFIREFQDKVNWYDISEYQKLSEDFIREFKNRVYWYDISAYQKLSDGFIREFSSKLKIDLVRKSWHYKNTEEKKRAIKDTGLYDCYEDYFIAYKGIRSDRYSKLNFQYKYEPGSIYESWCDCSSNNCGFGLSVWTEEKARAYCDELVVKVKVRYEDVGRVVCNGVHISGRIRCFKIEILD